MPSYLERIENWLSPAEPHSTVYVMRKLRPFLQQGETLMQFHSRTGLGRLQIIEMDRDQIKAFLAIVAAREIECAPPMFQPIVLYNHGYPPQPHLQPKPPSNIELIGWDGDSTYERADPADMFF